MPSDDARILVIDDEKQIRRMLQAALDGYGYNIAEASSGHEGLNQAAIFHPDLIILDLGLPDLDGTEVIQRLREWTQTPIIILSVREQESDKIKALDAGADDYITKPFSMGELLARIRVAMRHAAKTDDEPILSFGELSVDLAHRNLAQQAGRVVTHRQLLRAIWGANYQEESQYLRVYIGQLRRKIEADPSQPTYIITEPGVGYRLITRD